MAPAMSYGLRAEAVLTEDGRDVLDIEGLQLLRTIGSHGVRGAAEIMGVSESTVRRMMRKAEARAGGKLLQNGSLTERGRELIEEMELRMHLLDQQLEHLWRKPSLTCDGIVIREEGLLLVRRGGEPYRGWHALPGGFMECGERAEDCVVREVEEETGLRTEVVKLVEVFSDPGRDPRGHFVTLLYLLRETGGTLRAGDDADAVGFFDIGSLPPLAFDHPKLVRAGLNAATEHVL